MRFGMLPQEISEASISAVEQRNGIKRIFHHHSKWEEMPMWRQVPAKSRHRYAREAAMLMKKPDVFKAAMERAVREWPVSAEVNLSNPSNNRIAWLGHAGCYAATESPEDATRQGWHYLKRPEQDEANRVAAEVLTAWEERYAQAQIRD
jgi:hypothetical protein